MATAVHETLTTEDSPGWSARGKDALLAASFFLIASVVFTYPLARAPTHANRLDSPDALLNTWIVSWNVHQLARNPLEIYDANIFFPETGALAYSENLLTGALFAAPFAILSDSPPFLFNVVLLLGFATTGLATFLLALDVTNDRLASYLAGALFAFAPFRFAHIPHLQLELAFAIPLMLLFTRQVLKDAGLGRRAGLAITVPLAFGSSVYYAVFALTMVPWVVAFHECQARARAYLRLATAFVAGGLLTLPLAIPYLEKLRGGSERSLEAAREFSAAPIDYLSSFSHLHGFLPKSSEPLFPGFVALVLSAFAFSRSRRPWVWAVIALSGVAISFGPTLGVFTLLYETLPPYRALRVPSRAGVLFLLGVALLAAVGASRLKSSRLRRALALIAALECLAAPLPFATSLPEMPAIYRSVESLPPNGGALIELPMAPPERFQDNAIYVYRSAFHRRRIVNGYSGFVPASYAGAFARIMRGPFDEGLQSLAHDGVRYVLAHNGRLGPRMKRGVREAVEAGRLRLVAEAGEDRLYEITLDVP